MLKNNASKKKPKHSPEELKNVLAICNAKKYKFYITNPCFEFWLLMHICDIKKEYANDLNIFLDNVKISNGHTFTSYELAIKAHHKKSIPEGTFLCKYLPHIDKAVEHAKNDFQTDVFKLIGTKTGDINEYGEIGTNLYELIELLKENVF